MPDFEIIVEKNEELSDVVDVTFVNNDFLHSFDIHERRETTTESAVPENIVSTANDAAGLCQTCIIHNQRDVAPEVGEGLVGTCTGFISIITDAVTFPVVNSAKEAYATARMRITGPKKTDKYTATAMQMPCGQVCVDLYNHAID